MSVDAAYKRKYFEKMMNMDKETQIKL